MGDGRGFSFRRHDRVAVAPDDPLAEVRERRIRSDRSSRPRNALKTFTSHTEAMSRMGSPSPRSRDLSAVVNVEQPACALVDYPRVPVEHRLQATNAHTCVFHVVSDGPAWLSLMRGQISRCPGALPGSGTSGYVG